ncbi:hypothetical protein M378DRAFT_267517 [Amanita muscaria Koide BX008]|uniref:HNH nuclease domain-containing protein n=1 Tax=Amanita muscaria (strain Koide BX008) TaxID=946122 RepID=A0A0C2SW07_AMAMK|nr:hypothetical protein M378DRAFT_267517 [Amanita muscaria Koide BX008]
MTTSLMAVMLFGRRLTIHLAIMEPLPLPLFPLPLPNQPPDGYRWEEGTLSEISTTTAFKTGIDERDKFLERRCCIICGEGSDEVLHYCHIAPQAEQGTWLRDRGWIPFEIKKSCQHEPRNGPGLLLCNLHYAFFDGYAFLSPKFRSLSSSTIPVSPLFRSSMEKVLLLTPRIAMRRFLPCSSFMRCASVDSTLLHSLIHSCPMARLDLIGWGI